ncbi:hypothetical protein TNCV_425441 [Trichonephila clavipes]|nr:hypothetical protein TNCV_425441 [Trichonephila clavipes]
MTPELGTSSFLSSTLQKRQDFTDLIWSFNPSTWPISCRIRIRAYDSIAAKLESWKSSGHSRELMMSVASMESKTHHVEELMFITFNVAQNPYNHMEWKFGVEFKLKWDPYHFKQG